MELSQLVENILTAQGLEEWKASEKELETVKDSNPLEYVFFKSLIKFRTDKFNNSFEEKAFRKEFVQSNTLNLKGLKKQLKKDDGLTSFILGTIYWEKAKKDEEEITGKFNNLKTAEQYFRMSAAKGNKFAEDSLIFLRPMDCSFSGGEVESEKMFKLISEIKGDEGRLLGEIASKEKSTDKKEINKALKRLNEFSNRLVKLLRGRNIQNEYLNLPNNLKINELFRLCGEVDDEIEVLEKQKESLLKTVSGENDYVNFVSAVQQALIKQASQGAKDILDTFCQLTSRASLPYTQEALAYCIHSTKGYLGEKEKGSNISYFVEDVKAAGGTYELITDLETITNKTIEKYSSFLREQTAYSYPQGRWPRFDGNCLSDKKYIHISDSVNTVKKALENFSPKYAGWFDEYFHKGFIKITDEKNFTSAISPLHKEFRIYISATDSISDEDTIMHEFGHACHFLTYLETNKKPMSEPTTDKYLVSTEIFSQLFEFILFDYRMNQKDQADFTKGEVAGDLISSMISAFISQYWMTVIELRLIMKYHETDDGEFVAKSKDILDLIKTTFSIDGVYDSNLSNLAYIYNSDFYRSRYYSLKYYLGLVVSLCLFNEHKKGNPKFPEILDKAMNYSCKEPFITAVKHAGIDICDRKVINEAFSQVDNWIDDFASQEGELIGKFVLPFVKQSLKEAK
jgi:hypothetical protein